jgi:hypothetical protein
MDDRERSIAAEIERNHPEWVVIWGPYGHVFWAFPRFAVPSGAMVSASSSAELLDRMLALQAEFGQYPLVPAYSPRSPHSSLPRRRPLAPRDGQPGEVPVTTVDRAASPPDFRTAGTAPPLQSRPREPRLDDAHLYGLSSGREDRRP